jgi:hypothetical protein
MKFGRSCPLGWSGELDTAELGSRGIGLVVELDRENIVVARDRPIRPVGRNLAIVHGIVAAQSGEHRPPSVVLVKPGMGIADVNRFKPALQRMGHCLPFSSPLAARSGASSRVRSPIASGALFAQG